MATSSVRSNLQLKGKTNAKPKPWTMLLPRSLRFDRVLTDELKPFWEEAAFLINVIIRKMLRKKNGGYVRLHSTFLRKVISPERLARIKRCLKRAEVIETTSYSKARFSTGYRLHPRFLADRHRRHRPQDETVKKKLACVAAEMKERLDQRRLPIHRKLNKAQYRHLTIAEQQAEALFEKLPQEARLSQSVLLGNLVERRLGNSVCSTGRWFNGLTGLSRQLRPALRIAGEPLVCVDLVCCQPALLAMLATFVYPTVGPSGATTYKESPKSFPVPRCLALLRTKT